MTDGVLALETQSNSRLEGLQGWLLIPSIGFGLSYSVGSLGLIGLIIMALLPDTKLDLPYWIPKIFSYAISLACTFYVGGKFFAKKKETPRLMVAVTALGYVLGFAEWGTYLFLGVNDPRILGPEYIMLSIPGSVIWILYWLRSKRVKATFVQ